MPDRIPVTSPEMAARAISRSAGYDPERGCFIAVSETNDVETIRQGPIPGDGFFMSSVLAEEVGPDVLEPTIADPFVPNPAPDWLEVARCIPVWECSRVLFSPSPGVWDAGLVIEDDGRTFLVRRVAAGRDDFGIDRSDGRIVPDLSDPDTFAAARDRLALAMGALPTDVAEGATFAWEGPGWWLLRAGIIHDGAAAGGARWLALVPVVDGVTREPALALAWKAVVQP